MSYQLIDCKHGKFLVNQKDTYIGRSLYNTGEYCDEEVALLGKICEEGDIVIDGGANIGALTIPLAKKLGSGKLIAFEPQQIIFQNLCANVALNLINNIIALPIGLGEVSENLYLQLPLSIDGRSNFGMASVSQEQTDTVVEVRSLSSVFQQYNLSSLKLIKLDIEGMELPALKGAEPLIDKFKPFLYVENDKEKYSHDLINWILSKEYIIYYHVTPYFHENNYFGYTVNDMLGGSANLFCYHKDQILAPDVAEILQKFTQIKSPKQITFVENKSISWTAAP